MAERDDDDASLYNGVWAHHFFQSGGLFAFAARLSAANGPRGIGLIMQPVWHVARGRKQTARGAFVTWHATTQSTNSFFATEVAGVEIN
jgi:hypothetical protein